MSTSTPKAILEAVCQHYDVPESVLLGRARTGRRLHMRMLYIYLLRTQANMSVSAIARKLGRDHSTIHHALNGWGRTFDDCKTLTELLDSCAPTPPPTPPGSNGPTGSLSGVGVQQAKSI